MNKTRRANMSDNRKAGILCPVFSLSSKYGIGSFGESAYEFVRFLKKSKQTYWQIFVAINFCWKLHVYRHRQVD